MPEHQQIQQSKKPDTIFQKQATPVIQTPLSNPYSIIQRARINPQSLTHADIMQLQRTIGNQAVGRLLSSIGSSSTAQQATVQRQKIPEEEPLQGKMIETIQRQEIQEEEEPLQGKMAKTIQRQEIPEEEEPLQGKMEETVQRQEIPEEEEPLQGKFENKPEIACPSCFAAPIVQRQELEEKEKLLQGIMIDTVQRQEIPEEEEPLQGKIAETVQRQEIPEEEEPLQGKFEIIQCQEIPEEKEPLQTKKENNTGMPDNLKAGVENLSGIDMSDVRVHYDSDKPAEVGALAYTQGTDIHVAPGQERHLPHEAWHVVQQAQGRVRPTVQLKNGVPINDDKGLENEADVMGKKAFTSEQELTYVMQQNGGMVHRSHEISPSRTEYIQRTPWLNEVAKFKTDNGTDNIPKSEYLVEATTYKRYAPINEIRAPSQVYFEGPRSFAYIPPEHDGSNAVNDTEKAEPVPNNKINLTGGGKTIEANRIPSNGYGVWDGNVDDEFKVHEHHPGHPVTELGNPLPNLDSLERSKEKKDKQDQVKKQQTEGGIADDEAIMDDVNGFVRLFGSDDEAYKKALSILWKNPNKIPKLRAANAIYRP